MRCNEEGREKKGHSFHLPSLPHTLSSRFGFMCLGCDSAKCATARRKSIRGKKTKIFLTLLRECATYLISTIACCHILPECVTLVGGKLMCGKGRFQLVFCSAAINRFWSRRAVLLHFSFSGCTLNGNSPPLGALFRLSEAINTVLTNNVVSRRGINLVSD